MGSIYDFLGVKITDIVLMIDRENWFNSTSSLNYVCLRYMCQAWKDFKKGKYSEEIHIMSCLYLLG